MADPRPVLVLTRPEAASSRFAAAFSERFGRDWPVLIAPLMQIAAVPAEIPQAAAVIFTSENAVRFWPAAAPRPSLAWCVGARTAAAAAASGFAVRQGPGDAQGLVAAIRAAGAVDGPLVHAQGRHVAQDLAAELNSAGIETFSVVIYDQVALPAPPALTALLAGKAPVLLPLFSPRSAELLQNACPTRRAPLWLATMSPAVHGAAAALKAARQVCAATPDAGAMLDALAVLIAAEQPDADHPT
jgi:uroporphyrinogen-III synthase